MNVLCLKKESGQITKWRQWYISKKGPLFGWFDHFLDSKGRNLSFFCCFGKCKTSKIHFEINGLVGDMK